MTDWRHPDNRREAFQRFYGFHLKYRAHPGAVYYLFPYLRSHFGWDEEQALWFAFLNGNTQNPATSLLLWEAAPTPGDWRKLIDFWSENYPRLAFDTDRRYHKKDLPDALSGYLALVGGSQAQFWGKRKDLGWGATWGAARRIPTFGRLSAFSYAEYLRIMGFGPDCEDLLLGDSGSTSHRNGICILTGRDEWDNHKSNPKFPGAYPPRLLATLQREADSVLAEAHRRAEGNPWAGDVSYLTLESALCTYKSWHRPNRRYTNVYNDMLHDRIKAVEKEWPERDWSVLWEARAATLPPHLRLENNPSDPGVHRIKQNYYLTTGQPPVLGWEYPDMWTDLDQQIKDRTLGVFR